MSKGFATRLNTIYDIFVKVTYPSPSISRRPIKATKNSWAMKLHRSKLKLDTTNGHQFKEKKTQSITCVQNEDLQESYEWWAILLTVKLIGQTREDYLSLVHVPQAETIILQFLTKQRNLKSVVSRARETLPRIRPWLMDREEQRASGNPWNIFIISLLASHRSQSL